MHQRDSFDYVIVGGGTAGCVLAHRLSADASVSVLLLEAGDAVIAPESRMPAAFTSLFNTPLDWQYHTSAQRHLDRRRLFWPRMRGLGGCSAMNAMIYIRGNRADYDRWYAEFGAEGWDYASVLPYFLRAETNLSRRDRFHGTDGPQYVEDRRYTHDLSLAWVEAAVEAGLVRNDDFNGTDQLGAGLYQVTCREGRRWSVADGYLAAAADRPNLRIRTGVLASSVVLLRSRAVGVRYLCEGREHMVRADSEVIVACGAIGSPQLLMLSGIGAPEQLRAAGIEVAVALPGVGANLHDHPITPLVWRSTGTTDLRLDLATPRNVLRWHAGGTGPLASNIAEAGAFLNTANSAGPPDIQVHVTPTAFFDNGLRPHEAPMVTAGVTLVEVHSRGRLSLRSADPRAHPTLQPDYFADPRDLSAMLAGCRRALDIAGHPSFARYLHSPYLPGTDAPGEEAGLAAHVRAWTQTLYHPVGTCAMGRGPDAVVDASLRVYGVRALRVVDASVMPSIVRGNTSAPVIMIAERAADLIRTART
ncbi:GMC family oxidoreductase [Nocardia sp. bgisy134]|uniref:GMC family oxidoreductase n=1 Tax=Nocardia sp. bgisy134 TaxID=3413789 RepID=UPI003D705433